MTRTVDRHPEAHQWDVLVDRTSSEIAMTSGFGGGKTWTGVEFVISRKLDFPPEVPILCIAPTWRNGVQRIMLPSFDKAFEEMGVTHRYNASKGELTFGSRAHKIWFNSGENPATIKGPNVCGLWIDEAATQDRKVYENGGSRVRIKAPGVVSQILLTSTHEGLGWFYKLTKQRDVITTYASTTLDNPHNDPKYIARLERLYPDEARRRQYIQGIAVNMTGTIFTMLKPHHFQRMRSPLNGEVFLAWDFNVDHMVTVVGTELNGVVHFWGEVVSVGDVTTEQHAQRVIDYLMKNAVATRLVTHQGMMICHKWTGKQIGAVLDASAGNRSTRTRTTDAELVKQAGFRVIKERANPELRDSIADVQVVLNENRVFLDPEGCPALCEAVESHGYQPGSDPPTPQKRWPDDPDVLPLDHYTDVFRYGIHAMCGTITGGISVIR